jgi:hypothetical protein
MYSLKTVDYAKVEHDFKMFELVLNSICPDMCGTDMPVVILLSRNIAPPPYIPALITHSQYL